MWLSYVTEISQLMNLSILFFSLLKVGEDDLVGCCGWGAVVLSPDLCVSSCYFVVKRSPNRLGATCPRS